VVGWSGPERLWDAARTRVAILAFR
jgi:hypothetical protein